MNIRKILVAGWACSIILSLAACGGKDSKQSGQTRTGADRDEHGCIASAGYIWSEVRQDCIRLWEVGVRLQEAGGEDFLYLVLSPDSARLELFFSQEGMPNEILERRTLEAGGSVWTADGDDARTACLKNGRWTVAHGGKQMYEEAEPTAE